MFHLLVVLPLPLSENLRKQVCGRQYIVRLRHVLIVRKNLVLPNGFDPITKPIVGVCTNPHIDIFGDRYKSTIHLKIII